MVVLIDIGNSRIKWAQAKPLENSRRVNKAKTNKKRYDISIGNAITYDIDFIEDSIQELMDYWLDAEVVPSRVIVANVSNVEISEELDNAIWDNYQIEPEYLTTKRKFKDLINGYKKPGQLGVDRWLNMIGAYQLMHSSGEKDAFCVIDSGTALTVDLVDSKLQHQGGFITPGLSLMQKSLIETSTKISKNLSASNRSSVKDKVHKNNAKDSTLFFATDTKHAITAGINYSVVAYIEQVVLDITNTIKSNCKVYITGGDAEQIFSLIHFDDLSEITCFEHNEDLMWHGMLAYI